LARGLCAEAREQVPARCWGKGPACPSRDWCYAIPTGTPLASIAWVEQAEGSVKGKYLSKEKWVQCLVLLVFEF